MGVTDLGAGSTRSFMPSTVTTRTGSPASTGVADTASQYSPCTKTFPPGASAVRASPISFDQAAVGHQGFVRARARITSDTRNIVISAKGIGSGERGGKMNAQLRRTVDQQQRAQDHRQGSAAAENSVRCEFRFQARTAKRQESAAQRRPS